jgi:hypothetical protein
VKLHPDDFEVEEYEATRRSATVFAIDLSLSMAMRSNLVPAKKMVLALTSLIRSKFPRDFVAVVGFGETAQELKIEDVPALSIDYAYGTNLQHALALSRHLMRNERGERQIVVVTDGEPTAHLLDNGEPFFSWPPVRETLERTMAEVLRCTKAASPSTPSPWTSSAASSPSSSRSPRSTAGDSSTPTSTNWAPTPSTISCATVKPGEGFAKSLLSGLINSPFAFCHDSRHNDTVVITTVGVPLAGRNTTWKSSNLMSGMEDRGWQARANCMGVDPDLFFPERGASTREAKEVCRGCVAREDCLEYALDNGEKFGIWGGMSERERRRLRRARAIERRAQAG